MQNMIPRLVQHQVLERLRVKLDFRNTAGLGKAIWKDFAMSTP